MAARPQTNLRSIGRRRFAHLSDFGDEIHVDANIPWGASTLFTLEFRDDSRHYAIHTSNNRYLSRDGRLLEKCNEACLFAIEYFGGSFALRDTQGLYLAPLGSKVSIHPPPLAPAGGRLAPFRTNVLTDWFVFSIFSQAILKTRSTSVTKDELFTLEDSLAQAVFVSVMNGRHVSVKQGFSFYSAQFFFFTRVSSVGPAAPGQKVAALDLFGLKLSFSFFSRGSLKQRCHEGHPPRAY